MVTVWVSGSSIAQAELLQEENIINRNQCVISYFTIYLRAKPGSWVWSGLISVVVRTCTPTLSWPPMRNIPTPGPGLQETCPDLQSSNLTSSSHVPVVELHCTQLVLTDSICSKSSLKLVPPHKTRLSWEWESLGFCKSCNLHPVPEVGMNNSVKFPEKELVLTPPVINTA